MNLKHLLYSALARPDLQRLYRRLTGYLLRLQGYNNFPAAGGEIGISGEDWLIRTILADRVRVCIDVGANRGSYALELLAHTQSVVYAVEPIPAMAEMAVAATSNYGQRCHVLQCALSDQKGRARLRYRSDQTEAASLSAAVGEQVYLSDSEVEVEVSTLDDIVATHGIDRVDFIKLDVEGLELPCLRGAASTISDLRPMFIQVEMHWHHLFTGTTIHALHELLSGYHVYRLLPGGIWPVDPRAALDNLFAYSNYVFSREPITTHT